VGKRSTFTVGEVARMANISVRALHHYDQIGLVRPSQRSPAGYRQYTAVDLRRLQQVMSFKVLGFPLEEIRRLLADPQFDVKGALRLQRRLLADKADQVAALIRAVDAALATIEKGARKMTGPGLFDAFAGFDPALYEEEAKERWGETDAYRESRRRTSRYTKEQWTALREEGEQNYRALAVLLADGVPATAAAAMDLAERHRLHIERWFYPCPAAMHRGLGDLYVSDARFRKNIDRYRAGLATYLRDAIAANAARGTV
jgi:DNA-binding transcriptional MerR regulator